MTKNGTTEELQDAGKEKECWPWPSRKLFEYAWKTTHTKIGDKLYLQKEGGPIGLELTGAVSRAVMASWDKKYLKRVKQAGIKMLLYERYVDDSNQVAEVPDINQKHEKTKKILVKDKK